MGLLSKLHLKKKKSPGGKKKHEYESQDVAKPKPSSSRGEAKLVIGDAPKKPRFGGKGFESDAVYTLHKQRDDEEAKLQEARAGRIGEGAEALPEFGKPPTKGTDGPKPTDSDSAVDLKDGAGKAEDEPGSGEAGIGDAQSDPVVLRPSDNDAVTVNVILVLQVAAGLYVGGTLLFLLWLRPGFGMLFWGLLFGALAGLAYSFLLQSNRYEKRLLNDGFNLTPGRKGMTELLGDVPSWIAFQEKERVAWLNLAMKQMWPYYDKAVAAAIRESVEPIMDQYKPAGIIKRIYFKTLTFGDTPMVIDSVWLENEGENHVLMEIDFRLTGDSNIAIAIELPFGGELTQMVPKIKDLHVAGTARVILAPLCADIPCFGASVVSLKRPPLIHFNLDFGNALGGNTTARGVRLWLDPFLRETLGTLIVWPNRIVVPILPETVTGPLDDLLLKNVGLLLVTVVEAKDLDKQDLIGKSDPLVVCYTQSLHPEETKTKKKTLHPQWNEDLHMLVQEPKTQVMRCQVYDWDGVNVKDIFSHINPIQGIKHSIGSRTFMARTEVPIRPYYDSAGKQQDHWFDLGQNHWADEDGTGKGHGQIRFKITYWPFDLLYSKPRKSTLGAVLVTLKKAADLPAADSNGLSDPYVVLRLGDHKLKSSIKPASLSPVWDEKLDFVKVPKKELLRVEVFDNDPIDPDDSLGIVEIDIEQEVATAPRCTVNKRFFLQEVPKDSRTNEEKKASVYLEVQYVPYDFDPNE